MTNKATQAVEWQALIERNLKHATAARVRELFGEINPHLVGDNLFEKRWSDKRKDAAVLVPLIAREEGVRVIMTVRSSTMPSHAGQISFPGGNISQEDDGPVDTALREAREEITLASDPVEILGVLDVTLLPSGFAVAPVLAITDNLPALTPNPREVKEIFSIPLSLVCDLDQYHKDYLERDGSVREFYVLDYKDYYIWGATAKMLRTLAKVLIQSK